LFFHEGSLGVPHLKTLEVKPKRLPVVGANQAHSLVYRDRLAATITGLPEAETVPQLNRALAREATFFGPTPNELPDDIENHTSPTSHIGIGDQCAFGHRGGRRTA
jgi:hypothetical protein